MTDGNNEFGLIVYEGDSGRGLTKLIKRLFSSQKNLLPRIKDDFPTYDQYADVLQLQLRHVPEDRRAKNVVEMRNRLSTGQMDELTSWERTVRSRSDTTNVILPLEDGSDSVTLDELLMLNKIGEVFDLTAKNSSGKINLDLLFEQENLPYKDSHRRGEYVVDYLRWFPQQNKLVAPKQEYSTHVKRMISLMVERLGNPELVQAERNKAKKMIDWGIETDEKLDNAVEWVLDMYQDQLFDTSNSEIKNVLNAFKELYLLVGYVSENKKFTRPTQQRFIEVLNRRGDDFDITQAIRYRGR